MNVTYDKKERILNMKLTEEIDHNAVEKMRNKADFEIEKYMPMVVQIDLKEVKFMDSAGIGFILGRYKTTKIAGGKMVLINVNNSIKKILEMSGILKIVEINN